MSPLGDEDISWLLSLLISEDLTEIEVQCDAERWRVRVARKVADSQVPGMKIGSDERAPAEELPEDVVPVLAPMAGVFYRSPSPGAPPYVEEGDHVERGQVVGLIEAMKVFTEIESPVTGVVVRIHVGDQQTVKMDQRLMLVCVSQQ
jgi:acetyl-CoA carboxylase biotin carboxyl carrier protein